MNIGMNIKKLRRNHAMTQEELAETLNISAQAVSRWETDQAMPDITLLPSLANLFNVTIDELIGMDEIRNQAYLHEIYRIEHAYIADGKYAEAAETLRKALKTFPNNYGLMSELALSLSFGDVSTEEGTNAAREAIALCERVLENSTNEKVRSTTRASLCFLYRITGLGQEAEKLGRTLSHVWESREMILPELLEGQESVDYLKKVLPMILSLLCEKIDAAEGGRKEDTKRIIAIGPGDIPHTKEAKMVMIGEIADFLNQESTI